MKKILKSLLLVLTLFSFTLVNARENKLYFTGSGDRLYYDSSRYDDEYFMKHVDMVPGSSYEDRLTIENDSNYDYKLYMRVKNREQSELAKDLLKNIKMEITMNGELLYSGFADGLDYSHDNLDLTNTIYIGEYKSKMNGEIVVNTKLIEEYDVTENDEYSYVDWEFVAEYNDLVIPINPDTGDSQSGYIKILLISLTIVFALILFYLFAIKRKKVVIKKM